MTQLTSRMPGELAAPHSAPQPPVCSARAMKRRARIGGPCCGKPSWPWLTAYVINRGEDLTMVETIYANPTEALARRFQRFAEAEWRGASTLYEHLACSIAVDHELLALAAHAAQGQPVPNLLLAAV